VKSQTFLIGPDVDVSGTVPPTLALTLGAPASFGAFTPGVARDYATTLTATVISTAGDATLGVSDASSTAPGHMVNGAFALPQALQLRASSPAGGPGSAFAPLSSSPLALLTYTGPASNDPVTINVKQSIGSNDPLRTGTYSKTLTFTLSTNNP
jgi:beta-glucosidase